VTPGVAYQLTPDDPLIDNKQCKLDSELMADLGANTIRVYHVDSSQDHTACMQTFADAGIYLFVDLDTFDTQINPDKPAWNETQLRAFEKVMDEFQKYPNTAGFFVGNEVLTTGNNSIAAPYVKAAARDTKAYRDSKHYRKIPIGYSAADISTLRPMLQNYLACGSNASEAVDFYSLNAYEWCGTATDFKQSGYSMLEQNVTDYNIPIFLSETGCIKPPPRTFADQSAVLGPDMNENWSGAIVYEWIMEANDYGLINYGPKVDASAPDAPPDGYPRSGTPTPISPDFSNLKAQWATLHPSGVSADKYSPSLTPPACPPLTSGVWEVQGDVALPTLGATYNAAAASTITGGIPGPSGGSGGSGGSDGSGAPSSTAGAGGSTAEIAGVGAGLSGLLLAVMMWL
jgi:1,3-beta-glucanosyltransferase GAS1